jgi:hypothetical protein
MQYFKLIDIESREIPAEVLAGGAWAVRTIRENGDFEIAFCINGRMIGWTGTRSFSFFAGAQAERLKFTRAEREALAEDLFSGLEGERQILGRLSAHEKMHLRSIAS